MTTDLTCISNSASEPAHIESAHPPLLEPPTASYRRINTPAPEALCGLYLGRPLITLARSHCDRYNMDDQNQNDELYPIAVLIDELKVRIIPLFSGGSDAA